jgi:protein-S-isoprenylcysteine O-methyltransferase Ste14
MSAQPETTGPDAGLMRRFVKQTAVTLLVMAAILFVAAGTLDWPGAWVLLAETGVLGLVSAAIIARRDPELMRERMRGPIQSAQKPWDKGLLIAVFTLCVAMPIVAGLEVRFGTAAVPPWLQALGALALAFGLYVFHIVMETNSYASAVVRIQSERGHQVVSTGPYAWVRHPMYSGAIFYFLGLGLLLGSWWAVGIGVIILALFGLRAVWEEETLKRELDGYAAYAERVRYRLIPGVW